MRKIFISACILFSALGASAQNRKHLANFPLVQQYVNPSLTGFEGGIVKSVYRDQWTGFDDAPRTFFVSAELAGKDLVSWANGENRSVNGEAVSTTGGALGLYALHDTFGPFADTKIGLSYGASVRLSEKLSLRAGTAVTFSKQRMRSNELVLDQGYDPELMGYAGQDGAASKLDVDLGVTLTGDNFYLGYSLQDITNGWLAGGDGFYEDYYTSQHAVQAGVRASFANQFGIVVNGLYRYDKNNESSAEGQAKLVFQNTFWAGAGYRHDLAYTYIAGVRVGQFRVSYAFETTTGKAQYMAKGSNELSVSYTLFSPVVSKTGKVSIW
ncbi:MAG: PorP/SprF family type IX secretion system membrane protein [Rufibacter sp.]